MVAVAASVSASGPTVVGSVSGRPVVAIVVRASVAESEMVASVTDEASETNGSLTPTEAVRSLSCSKDCVERVLCRCSVELVSAMLSLRGACETGGNVGGSRGLLATARVSDSFGGISSIWRVAGLASVWVTTSAHVRAQSVINDLS